MVKDAGLNKYIRVGTVHRFQGLEAEVIIFDTVDSLPLKPPFRLTSGEWGSSAMRLVNVAITRAQQKLIIVANQEYIQKFFSARDTLSLAVQEAARSGVVQSADIMKESIPLLPELLRGSSCDIDLQGPLDADSFYKHFYQDLEQAKKHVILYAPYLYQNRLSNVLPKLKDLIRNGIRIDVIYDAVSPNNMHYKEYQQLINDLREAQIKLHVKPEVHEKIMIFDDDVFYIGSLNVLSHNKKTECMYRIKSPAAVKKLKKDWPVEADLALPEAEADLTRPKKEGPIIDIFANDLPPKGGICSNCNQELHLRFRKDGSGVFYGCPNHPKCGYTSSVTAIHLGNLLHLTSITCQQCKGPTRIESERKDYKTIDNWLVCAAVSSCGYGQPIKIKR